ncbi:MAG: Isoquinoline 1-oxidoreductase subunit, partial [Xanthobacteraceae bacterium]
MIALGLPFLTDVYSAEPSAVLATPQSFSGIGDTAARSAALFTEAGKVLTSPRCVNCHPAGDRPLQGETQRLHQPPVARGPDGFGTA